MSNQTFPAWWGPEGGDPILCRGAGEIGAGWIEHRGRYDAQTGRWLPEAPPPARRGRPLGLTRKRRAALVAIAAAEGAAHAPGARRKALIAAIKAKRAGA